MKDWFWYITWAIMIAGILCRAFEINAHTLGWI